MTFFIISFALLLKKIYQCALQNTVHWNINNRTLIKILVTCFGTRIMQSEECRSPPDVLEGMWVKQFLITVAPADCIRGVRDRQSMTV